MSQGGEPRPAELTPCSPCAFHFKGEVSWILDHQTGLQVNKWIWISDPPTSIFWVLELEVPHNPGLCGPWGPTQGLCQLNYVSSFSVSFLYLVSAKIELCTPALNKQALGPPSSCGGGGCYGMRKTPDGMKFLP